MDCRGFVADVHLAKLAKYLRLLGFDTLYFNTIEDNELLHIAKEQNRLILSKDKRLCKRDSKRCLLINAKELDMQVKEVLRRCPDLACKPFSRCLVDNTPLEPIEKEKILDRLPPKVKKYYTDFWICPTCGRIYWHGSHFEKMKRFIEQVCG